MSIVIISQPKPSLDDLADYVLLEPSIGVAPEENGYLMYGVLRRECENGVGLVFVYFWDQSQYSSAKDELLTPAIAGTSFFVPNNLEAVQAYLEEWPGEVSQKSWLKVLVNEGRLSRYEGEQTFSTLCQAMGHVLWRCWKLVESEEAQKLNHLVFVADTKVQRGIILWSMMQKLQKNPRFAENLLVEFDPSANSLLQKLRRWLHWGKK